MEDLKICPNPTKYGKFLFCEAVKVDTANSKETSFSNTISSTLSLITVVFEDLFEAINIHKECCDEKQNPQPSIASLNKTNTCDEYDFNIDFIYDDDYSALQKELLMLLEGYYIFGFWEFYKNLLCILVEVNKTMYGYNEDVPVKLLNIFLLSSPGIRNHMIQQVGATNSVFPQSYQTILNKRDVGTLKDRYIRDVALPRVPQEQIASPTLIAPPPGIPLSGYLQLPSWIPMLPRIGSILRLAREYSDLFPM
jgi:hypothetical protein